MCSCMPAGGKRGSLQVCACIRISNLHMPVIAHIECPSSRLDATSLGLYTGSQDRDRPKGCRACGDASYHPQGAALQMCDTSLPGWVSASPTEMKRDGRPGPNSENGIRGENKTAAFYMSGQAISCNSNLNPSKEEERKEREVILQWPRNDRFHQKQVCW